MAPLHAFLAGQQIRGRGYDCIAVANKGLDQVLYFYHYLLCVLNGINISEKLLANHFLLSGRTVAE